MIWMHGEHKLLEFLEYINRFHNSIKFTWEWSRKKVNFLDMQIINNEGQINTDLSSVRGLHCNTISFSFQQSQE